MQEQLFAGQAMVQLLGLGMLVPLAEELMFRGLIYLENPETNSNGGSDFFLCTFICIVSRKCDSDGICISACTDSGLAV